MLLSVFSQVGGALPKSALLPRLLEMDPGEVQVLPVIHVSQLFKGLLIYPREADRLVPS